MINLLLLWLLVGSISTNILWVELDKNVLEDFDLWKKRKNTVKESDYIKGFIFGLIFGPFARPVARKVNEKRSRNNRKD